MCMDTIGPAPDNARLIACIDHPNSNTYTPPDMQSGVYEIGTQSIRDPAQINVSVTLAKPLLHASVAAYLEGTYFIPMVIVTR
jgi:hypothetical protein